MKRFLIIGLGSFGSAMLEELLLRKVELVIVDKDEAEIEKYKQKVLASYVADAMEFSVLEQIVPDKADGCVVDLGSNLEASILVTHYLRKLGQTEIMVHGRSRSHGDILRLVGASSVVFPDQEAARRLVPGLINNGLISYTPLGGGLSFAEIPAPASLSGTLIRDARFREKFDLNIIAVRKRDAESSRDENPGTAKKGDAETQYRTVAADYSFAVDDVLLVSGNEESIAAYALRQSGDRPGDSHSVRVLKR